MVGQSAGTYCVDRVGQDVRLVSLVCLQALNISVRCLACATASMLCTYTRVRSCMG